MLTGRSASRLRGARQGGVDRLQRGAGAAQAAQAHPDPAGGARRRGVQLRAARALSLRVPRARARAPRRAAIAGAPRARPLARPLACPLTRPLARLPRVALHCRLRPARPARLRRRE